MKRLLFVSDMTLAEHTDRRGVLAEINANLAPAGWVSEPLHWRPAPMHGLLNGVYVEIDVPESPEGLLL